MFAYSDPTGTGSLEQAGALPVYRELVDRFYKRFHDVQNSAFTLLEAFAEASPANEAQTAAVNWRAFPIMQQSAGEAEIDRDRFQFQEEYVEWRVENNPDGSVARVTFTTEFSEYFEALAQVGAAALKAEVKKLQPGANPTDAELFGSGFNPSTATPRARAGRFRGNLPRNPWNNGRRGILCLTHGSNTLEALFNLLGACGIPQPGDPGNVCGNSSGACVDGRNSDPSVCIAAQNLARGGRSFALQDPCGIRIRGLDTSGQWTVDGQPIADINDENANRGVWKITRNGRRGTFTAQGDVRLAGAAIRTGADLAEQLIVGTDLVQAPDSALPEWARRGQEGLRAPIV
jgi:hypothetical protein